MVPELARVPERALDSGPELALVQALDLATERVPAQEPARVQVQAQGPVRELDLTLG